jgi:hypothetical protein
MSSREVKFPDITVQLSGEDGNVFGIIGRVTEALRRAGHREEAKQYSREMFAAESYDHALQITMSWVTVL